MLHHIICYLVIFCSLDAEYWNKMTSVIDKSKEHVWDGLIESFEKYLSILTDRASLLQETDSLSQQVNFFYSTESYTKSKLTLCDGSL